jgi:DNA-binding HxlR family transcriptional regulator
VDCKRDYQYALFSQLVSKRIPQVNAPQPGISPITHCPVETTLKVMGGKWKPLILFHLKASPCRFNALKRLIPGVTQRMMTAHLRELERDGIISRTVHAVVPPRVDYALTERGRTLMPILDAMAEWGLSAERAAA